MTNDYQNNNNMNMRPIDELLKRNFNALTQKVKFVSKYKIKTWYALTMVIFLTGFGAALVWSVSTQRVILTFSQQQPQNQVSNQAQVSFEDTTGNKYGLVVSNTVNTQIVQPQPQTCSQAGGSCYAKGCSSYDNCTALTGTCQGNQSCCSGTCTAPVQTCQGNVSYNQCSSNKPQYCQNGTLVDNCSTCGCPGNQVCQGNGSCLAPGQVQSEPFDINCKKQGRTDATGPVIIRIYQPGTTNLVAEINSNANNQGKAQAVRFNQAIPAGTYDLVIKIPACLTKKLFNVTWPPTQELNFGECKAGNLQDSDNVINSLDWSVMNTKWGTNDATSDINGDGIVNTLDWSLMNRNWGQSGE